MRKQHHNNNARLAAAVTNAIKIGKRYGWSHKEAKSFAYLKYNIKNQNGSNVDYAWLDRAKTLYGSWEAFQEPYERFRATCKGAARSTIGI